MMMGWIRVLEEAGFKGKLRKVGIWYIETPEGLSVQVYMDNKFERVVIS